MKVLSRTYSKFIIKINTKQKKSVSAQALTKMLKKVIALYIKALQAMEKNSIDKKEIRITCTILTFDKCSFLVLLS